jgi:hypothetical protein
MKGKSFTGKELWLIGHAKGLKKRTQLGRPPRGRGGRNVQNEPNFRDGAWGTRGVGRVETKPICPGSAEGRVAGGRNVRNKPNLGRPAAGAKSPTGKRCETNPISSGLTGRRAPSGPRMQNEPNSRRRRVGRGRGVLYKQSQFGRPAEGGAVRRNVRNEAPATLTRLGTRGGPYKQSQFAGRGCNHSSIPFGPVVQTNGKPSSLE